ncbi:MAG TPA: aquaporin, partial [Solirubrobacterales bacterium]|nr:aquaporin [Solirubrobacterales bacterium]
LLAKGLLLDEGRAGHYGAATISPLLGGNFQGFIVEAIGTFVLVLVVLSVLFNPRVRQEWGPLAIGFTLVFLIMVFGPLTGGAFNPARWFGPALIGEEFGDVWPYLGGELVGAVLAAGFFTLVIRPGERGPGPTEAAAERRLPGAG